MSEQKEFKLLEITTKEKADGDTVSYKYVPTNEDDAKDISITVKGESKAEALGMPTDSIGDTINIEFGAAIKQSKLDMEATVTDKKKEKQNIEKIVEDEIATSMGRAPNNTELFKTWVADEKIVKFDRQEFIDAYPVISKEKATKIISYQIDKKTIRQLGVNRFEVVGEL